jgi:HEPN domain-containing protein
VRKAEADVRVACDLAATAKPNRDIVCFHCQPAAEKYLKALLCELALPIPKIHDLEDLLVLVLPHHGVLSPLKRILISLTQYAVEYRYPNRSATTRQMRAALRHAERVRGESRRLLGLAP